MIIILLKNDQLQNIKYTVRIPTLSNIKIPTISKIRIPTISNIRYMEISL